MVGPSVINITPTHQRLIFAENIVVDMKLVEIGPGRSAMKQYLNGLEYNGKAHPLNLDPSLPAKQLMEGVEAWAARIIENPTGE